MKRNLFKMLALFACMFLYSDNLFADIDVANFNYSPQARCKDGECEATQMKVNYICVYDDADKNKVYFRSFFMDYANGMEVIVFKVTSENYQREGNYVTLSLVCVGGPAGSPPLYVKYWMTSDIDKVLGVRLYWNTPVEKMFNSDPNIYLTPALHIKDPKTKIPRPMTPLYLND